MAINSNRVKIVNENYRIYRILSSFIRKFIFIILMLISLSLVYVNSPISNKISNVTMEIVGPFLKGSLTIYDSLADIIFYIPKKISALQNMQEENNNLKTELLNLKNTNRKFQLINDDNIYLKKLLNVVKDQEFTYVSARLLNIVRTPFNNIALIGAGKNHGIKIDQIVTNDIGLIGKIIEVSDNYAKVILIEDHNSRIPVITSITATKGILTGEGNQCKISYIADDNDIESNEEILTSGDGKIYPPGIFVAKVTRVTNKNILVETSNNLADTKFVVVHVLNIEN